MRTGGTVSFSRCRASSMPSMSGMWMSESTRSVGVLPSSVRASRPLAASPTTTSGSAVVQSSSSSRSRRRAGASSSTISTLSGASATRLVRLLLLLLRAIGHAYMHLVAVAGQPVLETCLGVEMQRQALADVVQRHLVATAAARARLVGIAQDRVHFAAAQEDINRDHPRGATRLDAMVDGILQQRLEDQRRHHRILRHVVDVPVDGQTVAEAQLLQVEIMTAQLDLVLQRRELAVVAHQHAEQVSQVLERGFGAARVGA